MTVNDYSIVDATLLDATDENGHRQTVSVSATNVYVFFSNSIGDLVFEKSTDGGITWDGETIIDSTADWFGTSVWYDRWTPGDTTGNTIHITSCHVANEDVHYFSLGVDDDLPEAVNNVVVLAGDDLIPPADGHTSICKGKNDDLYISVSFGDAEATLQTGVQVARSVDAGATWVDITTPASGYDLHTGFAQAEDTINLVPMSTDNDIFALLNDNSAFNSWYTVYDRVAETWATPIQIDYLSSEDPGGSDYGHSVTCDKNTGDVYAIPAYGASFPSGGIKTIKYLDSTRVLTYSTLLFPLSTGHSEVQDYNEFSAPTICHATASGTLIVLMLLGKQGTDMKTFVWISNDSGSKWSDPMMLGGDNTDNFIHISLDASYLDPSFAFVPCTWNNDTNDIRAFRSLTFESVSGVVKDNVGDVVSGATVELFSETPTSHTATYITNQLLSKAITDGSGNYACHFVEQHYMFGITERKYWARAFKGSLIRTFPHFRWQFKGIGKTSDHSGWADVGSAYTINETTDVLDFDATIGGGSNWANYGDVNASMMYAVPSWLLTMKLVINNVSQGTSSVNHGFCFALSDSPTLWNGSTNDHIMYTIDINNSVLRHAVYVANNTAWIGSGSTPDATFARAVTAETLYVKIACYDAPMTSGAATVTIGLYSDADFQTLLEEETISNIPVMNTLDNIVFSANTSSSDAVLDGTVTDIRIYYSKEPDQINPVDPALTTDVIDCTFLVDKD